MSGCSDEMKSLLSAYVDDACTEPEKQAVERHIAQCADCRQELADLQWIVASLRTMPDIPLPDDFAATFQARLEAELAAEAADSSGILEGQASPAIAPLKVARKKHWFQSRRFVGIAATVLLCFSVSVIGGHINTGYDHLVRNGLYQETIEGEQSYQKNTATKKTTAVANGEQYNGGIFPGLSASKVVRDEGGVAASSRDGSVIEPYILDSPYEMKSEIMPEGPGEDGVKLDGGASPESNVATASVGPASGTNDREETPVEAPVAEREVRSAQNSQLQTQAARQMTVAQNASNREVYNGYIALVTEDVNGAKEQVVSVAAQYGGYVDEEAILSEESKENIRLAICVKSEHLEAAMDEIAGFGKVTAQSVNRVDLSDVYYDAQGRLTRQRALEQSLLRLIAEADDIETIHALEQELEKVTTEIETIIANLEKISQQRKYSTIVVNIASDPMAGVASATLGDKFRLGFQSFLGFCKSFPDNLLVGFGFMFEIFAVVLILLILFYLVMHKLLRKPAVVVSQKNEPEK